MKDIAIFGAGGLGREVAAELDFLVREDEPHNFIGFFDDGTAAGTQIGNFGKVLGGIDALNAWPAPLEIALCFGDGRATQSVHSKISNPHITFPNLIDRSFKITDPALFSIGTGNIIRPGCHVTTNVHIGDFNLLDGDVVFGHDVEVGSFNTFMPGCRISGEVTIGNLCLFGAMSFVKQQIKIGDKVHLSPLSSLITKPKDGSLYIGNQAMRQKF